MKIIRTHITEREETVPETLEEFRFWRFTSGSTVSVDFKVFAKVFCNHIKKILKDYDPRTEMVSINIGHYGVSGFLKRSGKFVYFSVSDVRHFPGDWHSNILIRRARSEKDYTGGLNRYTDLGHFAGRVGELFDYA